jgi:hypothetical protein
MIISDGEKGLIIAADNLNVLHPRISEALRALDPGPLQETAQLCEKAGAQFLDINPGYLFPPQRAKESLPSAGRGSLPGDAGRCRVGPGPDQCAEPGGPTAGSNDPGDG